MRQVAQISAKSVPQTPDLDEQLPLVGQSRVEGAAGWSDQPGRASPSARGRRATGRCQWAGER